MSENDGRGSVARSPLSDPRPALEADGRWAPWPTPVVIETTTSTMTEVADLAAAGAAEGTVVIAEEQTAGRGRVGRTWESPRSAGLWLSILLRPEKSASALGWLPLLTGVAAVNALRPLTNTPLRLKWPNDIVVDEGSRLLKLGGILAERLADGAVIVGIGVDVDQTASELPESGTSLRLLGSHASREQALVALLGEFAAAYRAWAVGSSVTPAYEALCLTLGSVVRVQRADGVLVGRARGLGPNGELLVADDAGATHSVSAGDVLLLRPAIE